MEKWFHLARNGLNLEVFGLKCSIYSIAGNIGGLQIWQFGPHKNSIGGFKFGSMLQYLDTSRYALEI